MMGRPSDDTAEETDDGLFLLLPQLEGTDDQRSEVVGVGEGELVGVVVRGAPVTKRLGRSRLTQESYDRLKAQLDLLIANRPVPAEIKGPPARAEGIPLPAHLQELRVWLAATRNRLVHSAGREGDTSSEPSTDLPVYIKPGGSTEQDMAAMSLVLLDTLIETAETQLKLLRQMRAASASSRRERVTLQTPTGPIEYTLPLSRDDTYSSTAVSEILSPTGKGHRSIAQHRRRAHELLGLKIGNQYRYPKFQIDPVRHEIRPVVAYANRMMESDADPWGTLDWWYSEDEALAGRRPVDLLDSGELTQKLVDFAIRHSQQGMD
jgi:hypothetical protein